MPGMRLEGGFPGDFPTGLIFEKITHVSKVLPERQKKPAAAAKMMCLIYTRRALQALDTCKG